MWTHKFISCNIFTVCSLYLIILTFFKLRVNISQLWVYISQLWLFLKLASSYLAILSLYLAILTFSKLSFYLAILFSQNSKFISHLSPGLVLKQHWLSHTSWMFFDVSGEHQPSMSTDSDTSLIMPVELVLSDVELQSDQEQDDAKSWSAINGAGPHRDNEWTWAKAAQVCNLLFWPLGLHHRKKNGLLVLFLWLYCAQCLLSPACVTRLEKPHGPTKDVSTFILENFDCFNFPMGSLPVYTRIFQNEYM